MVVEIERARLTNKIIQLQNENTALKKENQELAHAICDLMAGTINGAGKNAVYGFNRRIIDKAMKEVMETDGKDNPHSDYVSGGGPSTEGVRYDPDLGDKPKSAFRNYQNGY